MILFLCLLLSFCLDWEDISNTRDSVSSAIQTPRISSKILCCVLYFQLSSRCLDIPMKHCLECLIYYNSHLTSLRALQTVKPSITVATDEPRLLRSKSPYSSMQLWGVWKCGQLLHWVFTHIFSIKNKTMKKTENKKHTNL